MGYSYRRYFVAQDDLIYRMATAAFDRMLREPARFAVPEFADQRIRSAELVVELIGGDAVAVVRTSFSVLAFDAAGRLDMSRLRTQQMARLESMLSPVLRSRSRDDKIVEADTRFIAQGGHLDALEGVGHSDRGGCARASKVSAIAGARSRESSAVPTTTLINVGVLDRDVLGLKHVGSMGR